MFILLFTLVTMTEKHPAVAQSPAANGDPVHPARIYGSSVTKVEVGGHFEVRCSTFGLKGDDEQVFVYLCKNAVGLAVTESKKMDTHFTVDDVTKEHSGSYSCMFSKTKYHFCAVRGEGENTISIQVIDRVYPAVIVADKSKLVAGAAVNFRCTSTDAPDTGVLLLAYLCRNQTIVDVQMWDSQQKEARFHPQTAQQDNTGSYGCMVSDQLLATTEVDSCGKNSVTLRYGEELFQLTSALTSEIVVDKSRVIPGSEVNFRCNSTDAPDTGLLLAYLCRNQTIIDVNMWDSRKKETNFHLRSVQLDDTGNYSCVVSELPLAATESDACGRNAVLLEVCIPAVSEPEHWNNNLIRILCSIGVVIMAVVVLTTARFWGGRGVSKGPTETNHVVAIPMVARTAPLKNELSNDPQDI